MQQRGVDSPEELAAQTGAESSAELRCGADHAQPTSQGELRSIPFSIKEGSSPEEHAMQCKGAESRGATAE